MAEKKFDGIPQDLTPEFLMSNHVFIAMSMDGYIADREGGLQWLEQIPNPDKDDCGYQNFISSMDALVMGRNTFETVCGFEGDWPYQIPVFVLSRTLKETPIQYQNQVELVNKSIPELVEDLNCRGYHKLYIDGGATIQSFLKYNLIDEMILTIIPTVLGGGTSLFGDLAKPLNFELIATHTFLDAIVQNHYRRKDA